MRVLSTLASVVSLAGLAQAQFTEGWEPGPVTPGVAAVPALWTSVNNSPGGPGTNPNWQVRNDGGVFPAFVGTTCAFANFNSSTGSNNISNYLISPLVTFNNGDQISFYTRTVSSPAFPDRLALVYNTTGSVLPADFTNVLLTVNPTLTLAGYPTAWTQFTATISGLPGPAAGRFAFHYNPTNGGPAGANSDYIGIDEVVFSGTAPNPLVYVNGPIQTAATGGGTGGTSPVSVLQTAAPLSHTVFGYAAQQAASPTARNAVVDNFQVNSMLQVNEIEVFGYTTGATVPSATGVYVAIWNVDPATPTTPANQLITLPTANPNPFHTSNNRLSTAINTFTGIFRVTGSPLTGTTRNVQSVRINLGANPAVLTPGQYWLEFCFNGINFVPPIAATNVANTGDGRQFLNTTLAYAPILNGTTNTQGLAFNFYGPFGTPGSITNLGGGCSTSSLRVVGAPAVGGFFRAEVISPGPIPAVIVGFSNPNLLLPGCGCTLVASLDSFNINQTSLEVPIPRPLASLAGASVFVQAAEMFSGACSVGNIQLALTDGFRFTINLN